MKIMIHFLTKLINSPELENPAENHKNVHRHFYRYSKGDFIGPAIKISKSKARITLRSSLEYEDLIQEIVANTLPEGENVEIIASLISGSNIDDDIKNLGFNWDLKKSKGKTQNYKAEIADLVDKNSLIKAIRAFRENAYFLFSFDLNPTCKVTTKKRIPQPSKKKVEEDDVSKRIQFCSGIIENTEKNLDLTLDLTLEEFKSDIPNKWKTIQITNNYKITEIELPKNISNSMLLRLMAIRKGKLFRSVNIDGEIIEKQYNIVV